MTTVTVEAFDIRNFTDRLTPAKQKNRFLCPACGNDNLTIAPDTGKYQCWNGCDCRDIREVVSPWSEVKGGRNDSSSSALQADRTQIRKPKPQKPALIPEGNIELARLPEPITHPEKRKRGHQTEIKYPYCDTQWVLRVERPSYENPKGYDKATYPYHLGESGEPTKGKGDAAWNPYRMDEVQAYGAGSWVLADEGESCVEAGRYLGLVAFTLQGSAWTDDDLTRAMLQCKTAGVAGVAYFPDNDETGYKKADALAKASAKAQLPFIQINPTQLWSAIPEKGDIADWVKWGMEQSWNKEEFIMRLEEQFNAAAAVRREELVVAPIPDVEIVERFKQDLKRLANLDDPIIQLLEINQLASTYRMPSSEIRKAIAKVETATRTPKAQFFKLDDFLAMETEGIDYLIPGLLPKGETVLCVGLPKSGKTLLSIDAAFTVATGESRFLGESVQQGKVLIVSVDESAQSTNLKVIKGGFRPSDAEKVSVMTTWDVSQMGELEARLEDFRPDLVIIDSLKRITAGREISENSAEFADVIYQLKELTGRYGAASILIHHANKNNEAVGISKVRGSTAIAGACWGIWQLDPIIQTTDENGKPIKGKPKYDPSDPRRVFTAICRDAESQMLTIQFNPENHSYSVANEDVEAQAERKTQEQLILELLEQYHPNGLTGREIMDSLGLGKSCYNTLDRMVSKRTVTHRQSKTDRRSMVYALPQKGDTHPPLPCVKKVTNFSESIVVEPKINSHQLVTTWNEISHQLVVDAPKNPLDEYTEPLPSNEYSEISHQHSTDRGGVCVQGEILTNSDSPQLAHTPEPLTWDVGVTDVTPEATPLPEKPSIEPAESTQQFRVGDRVIIDYEGSRFNGCEGVVRSINLKDSEAEIDCPSNPNYPPTIPLDKVVRIE